MSVFQKCILALMAVALVLLAFLGRYEVVMGSRGDGMPPGYRLDRWTGSVHFLIARHMNEALPQDERTGGVKWEDFEPVKPPQR